MDIKDIQALIRFVAKSEVAEVNLKTKEFEIKIKTGGEAAPVQQVTYTAPQPVTQTVAAVPENPAPTTPAPEAPKAETSITDESKYITIKSPMIGTFYRKAGPDKPSFVEVGDTVSEGSVVCIVEAMKLFNEIESEVSGKIVKVLAEDSSPVEYDQPLFLVDPS